MPSNPPKCRQSATSLPLSPSLFCSLARTWGPLSKTRPNWQQWRQAAAIISSGSGCAPAHPCLRSSFAPLQHLCPLGWQPLNQRRTWQDRALPMRHNISNFMLIWVAPRAENFVRSAELKPKRQLESPSTCHSPTPLPFPYFLEGRFRYGFSIYSNGILSHCLFLLIYFLYRLLQRRARYYFCSHLSLSRSSLFLSFEDFICVLIFD